MYGSILGGSANVIQLGEWLRIGGPVIAILLGLFILALSVILLKLWQFAWLRLPAQLFIDRALEHWRARRPREALAALAGARTRRAIQRVPTAGRIGRKRAPPHTLSQIAGEYSTGAHSSGPAAEDCERGFDTPGNARAGKESRADATERGNASRS